MMGHDGLSVVKARGDSVGLRSTAAGVAPSSATPVSRLRTNLIEAYAVHAEMDATACVDVGVPGK